MFWLPVVLKHHKKLIANIVQYLSDEQDSEIQVFSIFMKLAVSVLKLTIP